MKTGTIAVSLAAVVVVAGIGYAFFQQQDTALAESAESQTIANNGDSVETLVHVDDLAAKPESQTGEFVLKAVVAKVNAEAGVISVIDSREFEHCGELTCAKNYLPVKVAGELPEPATKLLITGQLVRDKNGLAIHAKEIKSLP